METLEQVSKRKSEVCSKCRFHIILGGCIYCDYISVTGHMRPCPGCMCQEKGIFQTISKRKSRRRRHALEEPEKKQEKQEKPLTKAQIYYQKHKDKIKEQARNRYQNNKEDCRAKTKAWKEAHPEKAAEYRRNARAREKEEKIAMD